MNDAEAMDNILNDIFNIDMDAGIVYKFNTTYNNFDEIMEMEKEAVRSKIPEIDEEGFLQILGHKDSLACIFLYGNETHLNDTVYSNLAQFAAPLYPFIMNSSILKNHFPGDMETIEQILKADGGRYMFFPFGDAQTKKDKSLIFDKFDSNYLVGA